MPTGHASRRGHKDFGVNMTRVQNGCSLLVSTSCVEALTQASAQREIVRVPARPCKFSHGLPHQTCGLPHDRIR